MTKESLFKLTKEYGSITLGVIIIALGLESLYIPNNIAAGGLTGIALIINKYIPIFTVATITFLFNIILIFGAFTIIDRDFGVKTIYAIIVLPLAMEIFNKIFAGTPLISNLLLAVLTGSLIMSFGLSLLITRNASTGGTEILARILNKYSNINIAHALLCIDLFVTISGGIAFGIEKGIFALIAVTLTGKILNFILSTREKMASSINNEEICMGNEIELSYSTEEIIYFEN